MSTDQALNLSQNFELNTLPSTQATSCFQQGGESVWIIRAVPWSESRVAPDGQPRSQVG